MKLADRARWLAEQQADLVTGPTDYPTWLAAQTPADQDRALGPRRGAAYRAGELPVTRFTDPPLPPLSLEQLAATLGLTIPADPEPGDEP